MTDEAREAAWRAYRETSGDVLSEDFFKAGWDAHAAQSAEDVAALEELREALRLYPIDDDLPEAVRLNAALRALSAEASQSTGGGVNA